MNSNWLHWGVEQCDHTAMGDIYGNDDIVTVYVYFCNIGKTIRILGCIPINVIVECIA